MSLRISLDGSSWLWHNQEAPFERASDAERYIPQADDEQSTASRRVTRSAIRSDGISLAAAGIPLHVGASGATGKGKSPPSTLGSKAKQYVNNRIEMYGTCVIALAPCPCERVLVVESRSYDGIYFDFAEANEIEARIANFEVGSC